MCGQTFSASRIFLDFGERADEFLDEGRRDLRDDCIARTPQEAHTAGKPISQRENSGFNWPELAIPTSDPVSI
ncbi:hypothetical protein Gain_0027_047 [Komagataeibacter intermedius TF2]|nr:hypothetical protein Gain_0027_047 [Komagataeibacter intermedius TF2]